MATRHELEKKGWFRFIKVAFWLLAIAVVVLTLFIWYIAATSSVDASYAYFVCNGQTTQNPLTPSQKSYLESSQSSTDRYDPIAANEESINETCYQEYSDQDPTSASTAQVQSFRSFETGANGEVYTIQGLQHNWYVGYLIVALLLELLAFQVVRRLGLYIAGGKEALKS